MSSKVLSRLSLYIFYGLLAYMPLHIFLSTWLGTSFGVLEVAKVAKDVILVLSFLFAFCTSIRKSWFRQLLHDRLVWLITAYAALTVGLALVKPTDTDAEILGVVYNLRFLLFFLYGWLLTYLFEAKKLQATALKVVLIVGLAVTIFGVVQYVALPNDALKHVGYVRSNGVLPVFFIDDKPDLERVMSTLRDPNSLGSYLVILVPLAVLTSIRKKERSKKTVWMFFTLLIVLCVYLTFSRSAWIGFGLALASFMAFGSGFKQLMAKYKSLVVAGVISLVVLGLGSFYMFRDSYFVQNTILHADESTVLENPNELRLKFFRESIDDIANEPLGSGPGTAGLASIRNNVQGTQLNENYYLQIASEAGLVGFLLFLAILGVVGWRLWQVHNPMTIALLAGFIGLAVTNFLVHIWSNEAIAYTWWGLAALFLGKTGKNNSHNRAHKE